MTFYGKFYRHITKCWYPGTACMFLHSQYTTNRPFRWLGSPKWPYGILPGKPEFSSLTKVQIGQFFHRVSSGSEYLRWEFVFLLSSSLKLHNAWRITKNFIDILQNVGTLLLHLCFCILSIRRIIHFDDSGHQNDHTVYYPENKNSHLQLRFKKVNSFTEYLVDRNTWDENLYFWYRHL